MSTFHLQNNVPLSFKLIDTDVEVISAFKSAILNHNKIKCYEKKMFLVLIRFVITFSKFGKRGGNQKFSVHVCSLPLSLCLSLCQIKNFQFIFSPSCLLSPSVSLSLSVPLSRSLTFNFSLYRKLFFNSLATSSTFWAFPLAS